MSGETHVVIKINAPNVHIDICDESQLTTPPVKTAGAPPRESVGDVGNVSVELAPPSTESDATQPIPGRSSLMKIDNPAVAVVIEVRERRLG
jgi:hypothetical protein